VKAVKKAKKNGGSLLRLELLHHAVTGGARQQVARSRGHLLGARTAPPPP
jgi:hypothetical protein